jgi:hypothetical protein
MPHPELEGLREFFRNAALKAEQILPHGKKGLGRLENLTGAFACEL